MHIAKQPVIIALDIDRDRDEATHAARELPARIGTETGRHSDSRHQSRHGLQPDYVAARSGI